MVTKAELEAENARLRAQLAALEQGPAQTDAATGLTIGQAYYLSIGKATVVDFYEEEGIEKVRSLIQPFDPDDGVTLLEGERLCSMPRETFLKRMSEYRQLMLDLDREKRKRERLRR